MKMDMRISTLMIGKWMDHDISLILLRLKLFFCKSLTMSWMHLVGIYILVGLTWNVNAWKLYNRKLLAKQYRVKSRTAIAPETYIPEEAPVAGINYGNKSGNTLPMIQAYNSRQIRYQGRVVDTIFWNDGAENAEMSFFQAAVICCAVIVLISFMIWFLLGGRLG